MELAARIGQALLQENVLLKNQNDELNVFCDQLNDRVKQLKHDNERKTDMLNMFLHEHEVLDEYEDSDRDTLFDITKVDAKSVDLLTCEVIRGTM